MYSLRSGFIAGLCATVAVSMLMMVKAASHQFSELHMIPTLAGVLGAPDNLMVALGAHLIIGTVIWGGLFALLAPRIPGQSSLLTGVIFGLCAWLLMMVVFMPLAGAGLFAVNRGAYIVPLVTFFYHLIFGVVLGYVYGTQMPVLHRSPTRS